MQLPTPPLNALRVFDAIARTNSITKAAESLHITQSAASQQLKLLEEYLNIKLIKRNANLLELTPFGKRYAEKINRKSLGPYSRFRKIFPLESRSHGRCRLSKSFGL